jgi:hypothetical protein
MKQMEDRFNHWAHYDYVFLNDEVSQFVFGVGHRIDIQPFNDEFKEYVTAIAFFASADISGIPKD